jgi:putative oxidoreductase
MPLNPSIAEHRGFERLTGERDVVDVEVVRDHATAALIGRFLMAAIFVVSGVAKLTDTAGTAAHMTQMGIPYAETLALVAGGAEVLGALAIAAGLLTRLGSLGLILFMIPTTLIFHAFWAYEGQERMPQMVNFMKNVAIVGGLAALYAFGAGRFSLDHLIHRPRRSREW